MTLARFLETIKEKVGAFEGKKFYQKLDSLNKTMERINGEVDENRKIHDQTYEEMKELHYSYFLLQEMTDAQLKHFDIEQKQIRLSLEELKQKLEKKLEEIVDRPNSKTEDGTPSDANGEDLEQVASELLTKEFEKWHARIEKLSTSFAISFQGIDERQDLIEAKIENLDVNFNEKQTAMEGKIQDVTVKFEKRVTEFEEENATLEKRVEEIKKNNVDLAQFKEDEIETRNNVEKLLISMEENLKYRQEIKEEIKELQTTLSEFTQNPASDTKELEQKMKNEVDKLSKTLTELNTKVLKYDDETTTKFQKQDAKWTFREVLDTSLEKRLNQIETKLPSNTDFREIIEAQTRKFLEEHPELLKPNSQVSTQIDQLTNSYTVMSDRVEKLEATATKFADERSIKSLKTQMQERYDNLETKYEELQAQVKELSEKQTNA